MGGLFNKRGALVLAIFILSAFLIAGSSVYKHIPDYSTNIDLNENLDFKVGDYSLEYHTFEDFARLIGYSNSSYFSYRWDNPPSSTRLSIAGVNGTEKVVNVNNIPHLKSTGKNELFSNYKGKTQEALLDTNFLKKEGYLKGDAVPVIITLDIAKYMDAALEQKEKEQPLLEDSNAKEAFKKTRKELAAELEKGISSDMTELRIVNGVATKMSIAKLKNLESMDIVKRISLDKQVHIELFNSTKLINATSLWLQKDSNGNNLTGLNITIAIVDTGVDYTHPDLGGCFGSGCKVKEGYDFVNLDSDPMDDHGHGTHCAGIAAGNGAVLGVAPDANIAAYKVLDSSGSGSTSDVIAGIERALDPNNDGDYSDKADVISLSLGGSGNPDDEISQAVDAAVDVGAVVVVAAGNSGPYEESIGSPGCARKAITVGASCKPDQVGVLSYCDERIASFSSRGPTSTGDIKPDVVAPGVKICAAQWQDAWESSQCYDSEHTAISGTSMATPHVAGAAALLLQAHHNWSPQKVKSVLMITSTSFGLSPLSQGTGQINVLLANNASFATSPQSIGFGFIDNTNFRSGIKVTNLKDTNLTVSMGVSLIQDAEGNNYSFSSLNTSLMNLEQGESRNVSLIVNITGSIEGTFTGRVWLSHNGINGSVPFSFTRLSRLTVTVTGSQPVYPDLLVHNQNITVKRGVLQGIAFEGNSYTFDLPAGNYTVYAVGDTEDLTYEYILSAMVNLPLNENITKTLNVSDARPFTVKAESLNGQPLKLYKWEKGFISYKGNETLSYMFTDPGTGNRTVYISNKPDNGVSTDIILDYHGVPTNSPSEGGGSSRSIDY